MFLLDTNVVSELRQGGRGNAGVSDWYNGVPDEDLFTSALVIGEIRKGIAPAPRLPASGSSGNMAGSIKGFFRWAHPPG